LPHHIRFVFPFSAIVGQEKMKKALLLNAINPRIGGVLIRGQKGTGKSTAVRALADLLPEIKVVDGCPFNCNPDNPLEMCDICYERYEKGEKLPFIKRKVRIVNLPLNATVDRVAGTLDIKRAIKEGIKALEPGLLAEANRGILYIDEVNLLDDYVADILLDAAASGVNIVERESISVSHPARFILIGTMNPEEGELRPQLLDRFGLQVEVQPITDPKLQVEIVKRVEEFEKDPLNFIKKFEKEQKELKRKIAKARQLLPNVQISDTLLHNIASVCAQFAVSNRAIIVITKTAKTIAAFNERTSVIKKDVIEAMELALPHRMRKRPFEKPQLTPEEMQQITEKIEDNNEEYDPQRGTEETINKRSILSKDQVFNIGDPRPVNIEVEPKKWSMGKIRSGRRLRIKSTNKRGVYISSTLPKDKPTDIALDATIRAAAIHSRERVRGKDQIIKITDEDLREKVRRRKISTLIILVVDASGSMAALRRMEAAKGAALALLQDAYVHRDRVAFIAFRGNSSQLLLPPTNNIDLAVEALSKLPTGGKTPLSSGMFKALEIIELEKLKGNHLRPLIVLITDGKANVSLRGNIKDEIVEIGHKIKELGALTIVIDISYNDFAPSYIQDVVRATEAKHYKLRNLTAQRLHNVITTYLTYKYSK